MATHFVRLGIDMYPSTGNGCRSSSPASELPSVLVAVDVETRRTSRRLTRHHRSPRAVMGHRSARPGRHPTSDNILAELPGLLHLQPHVIGTGVPMLTTIACVDRHLDGPLRRRAAAEPPPGRRRRPCRGPLPAQTRGRRPSHHGPSERRHQDRPARRVRPPTCPAWT